MTPRILWWKLWGEQQPPIQWQSFPSSDSYKWGFVSELEKRLSLKKPLIFLAVEFMKNIGMSVN